MSDWHRKAIQGYFLDSGKTQIEIAAELGTTGQTVGRWLAGKTAITRPFQAKIETLLGRNAAPTCPLDNDHCPVYHNHQLDFQSAEMWRIWSTLDYKARASLVRIAKNKQTS